MKLIEQFGIYPKFETYVIPHKKLHDAMHQYVKEILEMEIVTFLSYDVETYAGTFGFDEDWIQDVITDEELEQLHERMPDFLHPDEWYMNYDNLLQKLFETKKVRRGSAIRIKGALHFEIHIPFGLRGLL